MKVPIINSLHDGAARTPESKSLICVLDYPVRVCAAGHLRDTWLLHRLPIFDARPAVSLTAGQTAGRLSGQRPA
jgi:hypothetical protein